MIKTTYKFVVLSECPIPEMELSTLIHECEMGDYYVLASIEDKSETLTGRQMARALIDAGSDPTFFPA